MIAKTLRIVNVDYRLYGNPLVNEVEAQVNGAFNNSTIRLTFEYNGSWEIQHSCCRCSEKVSFGLEYVKEKSEYPVRTYTEMKYFCSKYYNDSFLRHLSNVFSGVELIQQENKFYLASKETFELDYPVTSSIEPIYYSCTKCNADYLALVPMAAPILPDKDIPFGKKGLISVDEIVYIEMEGGKSLAEVVQNNLLV